MFLHHVQEIHYESTRVDNIGLGKGIHPKDETQDTEACRFVSPPIVGINKKCRDRHQRMLENVNENAERKELYDWLQRQGCTDMYGVIVDEGFEKLEDFITGDITTADMQELADAAREGEGHSRAMSFDDSTFRARLCQTLCTTANGQDRRVPTFQDD